MTPQPADVKNVEAEAALVGSLMMTSRLIDRVADQLDAEDFGEAVFGRIYSAILAEHSAGRPANPVTLRPLLEKDPLVQAAGGVRILPALTGSGAAIIGTMDFVEQIRDLAKRRRLLSGLQAAALQCDDCEQPISHAVDLADAAIAEAIDIGSNDANLSAGACIAQALEPQQPGVECGNIPSFDRLVGPLRPKQLVIVAGRPGMGKTAMALSYALGAAAKGHGTFFVSLEMSASELGARMASDLCFDGQSGVSFADISTNCLGPDHGRRVARQIERAERMPFRILDTGSLQTGRLNMAIRREARRLAGNGQKLELVVVDYLQLLRPDQRFSSQYEAVSEVSRSLKAIAKQNDVAIMALTQLSREVERRADRRPQLSDLRDSGQIEQDADAVVFLVRPEYYLKLEEPGAHDPNYAAWVDEMRALAGRLDLIVAKRRNGVTGRAEAVFASQYQAVRG